MDRTKKLASPKLDPNSGNIKVVGEDVTLWVYGRWAKGWYVDTQNEAKCDDSNPKIRDDAKRREIVNAICFLESYLYEWVRDEVLKGEVSQLSRYFDRESNLAKRWKKVTQNLLDDGKIERRQSFTEVVWQEFNLVYDLRHWLCHGVASKPLRSDEIVSAQKRESGSNPDAKCRDVFKNRAKNGWALGVVTKLVEELHFAAGDKNLLEGWIESSKE